MPCSLSTFQAELRFDPFPGLKAPGFVLEGFQP